ncbi:MAG: hypothetical protein R3F50_00900 [Gammaproteobacteria bacterium]|jgi:hypothetical protein
MKDFRALDLFRLVTFLPIIVVLVAAVHNGHFDRQLPGNQLVAAIEQTLE